MEFAPKTILCLVDLSAASANVLRWSGLFAERYGAEVRVFHAMWPPVPRAVSEAEGEQLLGEFEERRIELSRSISAHAEGVLGRGIHYEVGVGVGHPVKVVLDFIGQMRPGLTVLGSHGHDGMARSLMGSVAENVVRESEFPTLVVKGPDLAAGRDGLKKILCPVDLTGLTAQSLDAAASVAGTFDAQLDVLQVLAEPVSDAAAELGRLREWATTVVGRRCPASENVHSGEAAEQIVLFARQHAAELIVMGTEPRKFLEFTVMGRTTERVVRHGPCSVLLLRPESRSN